MAAVGLAFVEEAIVFDECIDGADTEHGRKVAVMGFAVMIGDDIIGDFCQTVRGFEEFFGVDVFDLDIEIGFAALFFFVFADIFDREFQDVFIADGIGDDVFVEALVEEFPGGSFAQVVFYRVFGKDGGAGKAEHPGVEEEFFDAFMGFTELAAVAFVEDEDDLAVFLGFHFFEVAFVVDGVVEFLDGGQDEGGGIVVELADEHPGIFRCIDTAFAEGIEFFLGLVIEVFAVYHKHDFMDFGVSDEYLAGFEGGEGFTGAGGMPDVPVFPAVFDAVDECFDGVVLVGAEDHEDFPGLVEHGVFGDHFADVAGLEEFAGEGFQLGNGFIGGVGPVEGLFEGLFAVIGIVFGIDAVADDEYLDVLEESAAGPVGVALVAVGLVEGFFEFEAAAFEFDLNQGQAVDQEGDVVAVFVGAFHGDLPGDLEMVLAPVFLLEEFDIDVLAVVFFDLHFIAKDGGALEYVSFVEVVEDP